MLGSTEIYNALNVTVITSLLDARNTKDTKPALINDKVIPSAWTAKKTINFYLNAPVSFSREIQDYIYSANCRGSSQYDSQQIAYTVATELSRKFITGGYCKVKVLPTINPQDSTDNYNTQVEITFSPTSI